MSKSMEEIEFRDLSIADLFAMHTNYWLTQKLQPGSRFQKISQRQFEFIEVAIQIKVGLIKFPKDEFVVKNKQHND